MKELFLDSANIDEIRELIRTDAIQGVTTNPSLMAKESKGCYLTKLGEIAEVISKYARGRRDLSVEVITSDPNEMVKHAVRLRDELDDWDDRVKIFIKIPIMLQTLEVITELRERKIRTNATAAITCLQAKLAEDAGADVVSFFYRRGKDAQEDMDLELQRFGELRRNCRVICGSIREPMDVFKCWSSGADIVTAPYHVIEKMTRHPQTDKAIEGFQKDIDQWLS